MTDQSGEQDPRWVTHVRVVVHEETAMPSPEIRGLGRQDVFVDRHAIAKCKPVARSFATCADEHRRGLTTCTPATLASTVWVPRPPVVLASYGSALWAWLPPALTRGVARVDVAKIARLLWPDGPAHSPERMVDYVQSFGPAWVSTGTGSDHLARRALAVTDILSAALLVAGDRLVEMAATSSETSISALSDTFGAMAGDPRIEAMVRLSVPPMPPLMSVPAPWDEAESWFALAADELAWVASDARASDFERESAEAELARRAARDEALLQPRSLLRRLGLG